MAKMTDLFSSMNCLDKAEKLISLWMKIKCGAMSYDCTELNKSSMFCYVCTFCNILGKWIAVGYNIGMNFNLASHRICR